MCGRDKLLLYKFFLTILWFIFITLDVSETVVGTTMVSPQDKTYNSLLLYNTTVPPNSRLQHHYLRAAIHSSTMNVSMMSLINISSTISHAQNTSGHHHHQHLHADKNASNHHHHSTIIHDIKSAKFQTIAKHTLKIIHNNCLFTHFYEQNNAHGHVYPKEFIFPDDAEQHFEQLQAAIKPFLSKNPIHQYAGYNGPWIENVWINHFKDKPLAYFRGLFPIFLNWIDSEIVKDMPAMITALQSVIRKDCIYITVSQGDAGLHEAAEYFPNILALSAGGFGHIVLPLIKGELPATNISATTSFENDLAFYGTDRKERHRLLMRTKEEAERLGLRFHIGYGNRTPFSTCVN